jgi:hypothetical protein
MSASTHAYLSFCQCYWCHEHFLYVQIEEINTILSEHQQAEESLGENKGNYPRTPGRPLSLIALQVSLLALTKPPWNSLAIPEKRWNG